MPKQEHTPLTDAELDEQERHHEIISEFAARKHLVLRLIAEVREQRRLLRAVEGHADTCPVCDICAEIGDELGRYLAACEGREQG